MVIISDKFQSILRILSIFFMIAVRNIYADDGLSNLPMKRVSERKTVNVFAESLYWYTSETLDWAFTLTSAQNSVQTDYKTFSFDWAPGFCVGLGYNTNNDRWDTKASYTWFQSKAQGQTRGPVTPAFLGARLSLLEPFSTGKATLNLRYNMFDYDLGRNFLVGNHLFLRPAIGLRGGWIEQAIYSDWTIPHFLDLFFFSASENLKQKFKAGGPKVGLTGKWYFRNFRRLSVSLIGQFDAGYLWGHWSIQDKFIDNLDTVIYVKTSDRNFGSFMLRAFMGLGWDCNFVHDRVFRLKLGYEIEDWLNQCQIFSDASGSQNNDLILQGINFGLYFDF